MVIGIDIDNTLTVVQEELNQAAFEYAKKLGKDIKDANNPLEDIKNNGDTYKEKFKFNYDELQYFLRNIQEEIVNKAIPRVGAVETIHKLREEGHTIYIVTARDSEFHDDPYTLSKDWLKKNNIEYDKLIVNARQKAPICEHEKIQLFIDDQLNNCMDIQKTGIKVIRISDDNKEFENVTTLHNWNEIYKFIKEMSRG